MPLTDLKQLRRTWWLRSMLLLAAAALAAILWLMLLPRAARDRSMAHSIQQTELQGIDTGAFFYTDHPRSNAR